jgi:hypothetical protein
MDPAGSATLAEANTSFASGVARFSSGIIKTKGRYVLVKTYVSQAESKFKYVGYDEIFVSKGAFDPQSISVESKGTLSKKQLDIPAEIMGYRLRPPNWVKISKEHPLYFSLAPMQMLGDDEFHLSTDGVYVLTFSPLKNTRDAISAIEFSVEIPESIEILSYNSFHKFKKTSITRDGKPYNLCAFQIKEEVFKSYMNYPYLVVKSEAQPGLIGNAFYQYSYSSGGKKFSHDGAFLLIVDPKITAPVPKRFMTGFWLPYQTQYFDNLGDVLDQLVGFYSQVGFNYLLGSGGPETFQTGKKYGFTVLKEGVINNGLMLSGYKTPESDRFIYHEAKTRPYEGVCPTLLYTDATYRNLIKERIAETLRVAHHVYANWEPFMFQKQGCVCERCKNEYGKFNKLSEASLALMWPSVVTNLKSEEHNRFSSYQYASIIRLCQSLTREVGEQMKLTYQPNFVIAFEPGYVEPGNPWYLAHDHHAFYQDIDAAIMWFYPNTVSLTGFDPKSIYANNLTPLLPAFRNFKNVRLESKSPRLGSPKTLFMATEYFDLEAVLPKDFYFTSLLCFFDGLEGYGTWSFHFKADARMLSLNAKANQVIAQLEDLVLDAEKTTNTSVVIISPVPEKIGNKSVTLSVVRSFKNQGNFLVALGNDYPHAIYAELKIKNLEPGNYRLYDKIGSEVYQKEDGLGFTEKELALGVLIRVRGKEWAALKVTTEREVGNTISINKKNLEEKLLVETPKLKEFLNEMGSL